MAVLGAERHTGRVTRRASAGWAAAMALLGWVMMTIGAFVRASESGLGCPDWPACHGRLIAGGHHALIEEFHRWVATTLILGVAGLGVTVLRRHRRERGTTRPMLCVLALLALQVVLGGVTVLLKNVSWTVVLHYGAAALLVAAIVLLAVRLAAPPDKSKGRPASRDSFTRLVGWFVTLSFGLLLAGSTVANTDSHTSCGRGFPLCNGSLTPTLDHHVVINLMHRTWAGVMLLLALWVLFRSRRARPQEPVIQAAALAVMTLYLLQAATGIVVVAVGENTAVEVLHSSIASLTWVALATLLAFSRTSLPAQAGSGYGEPSVETTDGALTPPRQAAKL